MERSDFSGHVFLITGAASGMGRQMALQAAGRGARVIAADRDVPGLEETGRLAGALRERVEGHPLDVSDGAAIAQFAQTIIPGLANRKLVLINNAGVGLRSGTFATTELADFEWLLNINLWGAIRMTKAFYPYLLARNEGHIVNISSVFGLIGVAHNLPYCTSKFALRGFTESLRMELRGTGIRTTTVHPGGIKTNIVRNTLLREPGADHARSIAAFDRHARTTAESAARQILDAVARRREKLVIGADGRAIDLVARLFPVRYTDIVYRQLRKAFGVR